MEVEEPSKPKEPTTKSYPKITNLLMAGISDSEHNYGQRIILANVIFLIVPPIIFLSYLLDVKEYLQPVENLNFDQFTRLMFGMASLGCYFINKSGHFLLSRWVYLLSWLAFWLILDPVIQGTEEDYYFHFDLSIIGLAIVSQILFSRKKEPFLFWTIMVITAVFIIFQQRFLLYFDSKPEVAAILLDNQYTYFTSIYYWAIFNLIIGYLIFIYENSNEQLIKNNEQLDRLTTNLEGAVKDRTIDLERKQAELLEIAEELRRSEEKYRTLFTNSLEAIARLEIKKGLNLSAGKAEQLEYLEKNLVIADCNDQFAQLYAKSTAAEFIGKSYVQCVNDQEATKVLLSTLIASDYHVDGITLKEQINQKDNWFINHISSTIEAEHLRWIWLNKLDVTEKSLHDKERKELLCNLEEYAFQTSHQLRGPLSRPLGLTNLILSEKAIKKEELPEMLQHINSTSNEIDEVIKMMNDVLSRSKFVSKLNKS